MYILENTIWYLTVAFALFIFLSFLAIFLHWIRGIDIKYVYSVMGSMFFVGFILFMVRIYYVHQVKKHYKKDLTTCSVFSINDILLDGNASIEIYNAIKKPKFESRNSGNGYGYEINLECKTKDIRLIIEQADYKKGYYFLYTKSYSHKEYMLLGRIRTGVLSKYAEKGISHYEGSSSLELK